MLTLLTLDASTQRFKQTQFSIVDLAGAERPEKALGERISKEKAMQARCQDALASEHEITAQIIHATDSLRVTWLLSCALSLSSCARTGDDSVHEDALRRHVARPPGLSHQF